jgi:hypothetical protein
MKSIEDIVKILKEDIEVFQRDIETAHSSDFRALSQGRLKEAKWILGNILPAEELQEEASTEPGDR